jgi:hypothetical protein
MNVTDTASASGSLLLDLQTGGASQFRVNKFGTAYINGGIYVTNDTGVQILTNSGMFVFGLVQDLLLGRNAAASLRLGNADAAAPVAQTLGVQSVVAGTTNTAGTNFTIKGSAGTGTGAGGSIIFQTAAAGSSGTSQNAFATALTINSSKQNILDPGTAALPTLTWSNDVSTGFYKSATSIVDLTIGGTQTFRWSANGFFFTTSTGQVAVSSGGSFAFSSGTAGAAGADLAIYRDAANTLALRNGTNAQTFNVYNTYTDASNYERGALYWSSNLLILSAQGAGTGSVRQVVLSGNAVNINPAVGGWIFNSSGHLTVSVDNTYDIGASGANRPRDVYVARHISCNGYIQPSYVRLTDGVNEVRIYRAGNGVMTLYNAAETDFNRIQFGGTTSSFPALKRNSTALETKLADDSAYAPHAMQYLDVTDGITAPASATGRARIYVDTADGDLKVIFADGTVKTIVTDT